MIYLNCVGKSGLFSSKFKLSLSNNIIGVILITVTLVIKLMMASEETDVLAECKEAISKYVRTRATHIAKVTIIINKFIHIESECKFNKFIFDTNYEKINNELLEIKSLDDKILNVMSQLEIDITEPDFFNKEIERSSNYHFDLSVEIFNFGNYLEQNKTQVNESVCSNEQFIEMMSKINTSQNYKLPVINCDQFDGSQKDKLVFHNFLTKFNNIIGKKESLEDSVKLMYYKNCLYAFTDLSSVYIIYLYFKFSLLRVCRVGGLFFVSICSTFVFKNFPANLPSLFSKLHQI